MMGAGVRPKKRKIKMKSKIRKRMKRKRKIKSRTGVAKDAAASGATRSLFRSLSS
jgi:hypothetical protein